jgi:putative colanic acid biosynthesis acetyltransferase WcaF
VNTPRTSSEFESLIEPASTDSGFHADVAWVDLSAFDNSDYDPGRGRFTRALWYAVSVVVFESGWFPLSRLKVTLLRLFGAKIGVGVVVKPNVRIKYPWRLTVGDYCWIGQESWIDNIADVEIGDHACISQLAYLCTGSHDHRRVAFNLAAEPIHIGNGAWVGARATVLPGVSIGANAIVAGGSVVTKDVASGVVAGGAPARIIAERARPTA